MLVTTTTTTMTTTNHVAPNCSMHLQPRSFWRSCKVSPPPQRWCSWCRALLLVSAAAHHPQQIILPFVCFWQRHHCGLGRTAPQSCGGRLVGLRSLHTVFTLHPVVPSVVPSSLYEPLYEASCPWVLSIALLCPAHMSGLHPVANGIMAVIAIIMFSAHHMAFMLILPVACCLKSAQGFLFHFKWRDWVDQNVCVRAPPEMQAQWEQAIRAPTYIVLIVLASYALLGSDHDQLRHTIVLEIYLYFVDQLFTVYGLPIVGVSPTDWFPVLTVCPVPAISKSHSSLMEKCKVGYRRLFATTGLLVDPAAPQSILVRSTQRTVPSTLCLPYLHLAFKNVDKLPRMYPSYDIGGLHIVVGGDLIPSLVAAGMLNEEETGTYTIAPYDKIDAEDGNPLRVFDVQKLQEERRKPLVPNVVERSIKCSLFTTSKVALVVDPLSDYDIVVLHPLPWWVWPDTVMFGFHARSAAQYNATVEKKEMKILVVNAKPCIH
eukprot:TRINITY_DN67197_c1_g1_i2.p1 TRINITY_DN67197_c1_g1~~TRINITY_DN67197_c1_g1_i2.p1  ORF type:complete len:488 (+),score=43.99 TRINITY_DN67197_c1_g1_i2:345-1808(+)